MLDFEFIKRFRVDLLNLKRKIVKDINSSLALLDCQVKTLSYDHVTKDWYSEVNISVEFTKSKEEILKCVTKHLDKMQNRWIGLTNDIKEDFLKIFIYFLSNVELNVKLPTSSEVLVESSPESSSSRTPDSEYPEINMMSLNKNGYFDRLKNTLNDVIDTLIAWNSSMEKFLNIQYLKLIEFPDDITNTETFTEIKGNIHNQFKDLVNETIRSTVDKIRHLIKEFRESIAVFLDKTNLVVEFPVDSIPEGLAKRRRIDSVSEVSSTSDSKDDLFIPASSCSAMDVSDSSENILEINRTFDDDLKLFTEEYDRVYSLLDNLERSQSSEIFKDFQTVAEFLTLLIQQGLALASKFPLMKDKIHSDLESINSKSEDLKKLILSSVKSFDSSVKDDTLQVLGVQSEDLQIPLQGVEANDSPIVTTASTSLETEVINSQVVNISAGLFETEDSNILSISSGEWIKMTSIQLNEIPKVPAVYEMILKSSRKVFFIGYTSNLRRKINIYQKNEPSGSHYLDHFISRNMPSIYIMFSLMINLENAREEVESRVGIFKLKYNCRPMFN